MSSNQLFKSQHEQAYMSLMRGMKELDLQGPCVPSDLLLIGDHAFPLAMNSRGQVLMAASLYSSGRIVVLGHEGYLTAFPALVENALTWLRGDGSDNLSVGVHRSVCAVANNLQKSSFQVEVVGAFSDKQGVGVYVTDAYSVGSDPVELVAFLKAGGGVLIAGQAWSWAADHPKENALHQFDGNKVSGVAGIYFTERCGEVENLPVYPQIPSSWMSVVLGKDFEDDLQFLLQGVSEFQLPSNLTASEVLVHGPLAFPIATTDDGRAFLAGGYYGQGRVIVATHEGFLGLESMAPFWQNAIHWLDEGRRGVVGVMNIDAAINILSKSGLKCEKTKFRKDLSVFVCKAYITEHLEEIKNFVAEGGGLLIGGHAWYWAQTHSGQNPLTEFSGNKILNQMGLSLLGATIGGGTYKALVPTQAIKDSYHFRHLLYRFAAHVTAGENLSQHEERYLKRLGNDCNAYLQMKAHDSSHYRQVLATLTDLLKRSGLPQVSDSCPVKSPKDHLLLAVGTQVYKVCPDPDALLPYLIKDNPMMPVVYNHRIKVDVDTADREEWISTGLYLSPGMKTYIAIPPQIVNKDWKIQIGCQTDSLHHHEELKRPPSVHERFPVTSEMIQVWNLWGGLIFLVAPPKTQVKVLEVIVQMAVPAPYYKSDVTTAAQWSLLRTAPSPWAELEFENIILTVPSDAVRGLERPDELAALWDEIMRAIADLAAKPHKFPRKERFVTDVQISAGWMHAGYPIMAHKVSAAELVGVKKGKEMWGPIHELGHNQQRGCWEFPPNTTECTCNLWSVYVHEEVLGLHRGQAHGAMTAENRQSRAKDYVAGGRKPESWSMWVALETYMQLQERFGWDAFKKVFTAYHHMKDIPKDNKGKMNLYAETFSQTVGMDLTGFFKAWGWPIETATEGKLSQLPSWNDHPMTQYD
uniref:TRPM8 channel-associated factor homolog n=1 Tax=Maylandia zebra TaxID=106582 RepID=A0A3P9BBU5_9CICH|nr:TRPM8 channel-associated factor homolog [Maylandia zebra]XP_014268337.2 TRPM8 channel-associated factor homolog [Maylandia zebra]